MAIGQSVYTTRLPSQHSQLTFPFGGSIPSHLHNDNRKQPTSDRHSSKGGKHSDMTKATSYGAMSTPRATPANKNAIASSSSRVVTPARPIDTASTSQHRRQSSQSLTLDLEGLDLGQGMRSAGGLEQPREEAPWSRRAESRSRSRFRATTSAAKMPEEPPKQDKHVEDSFFAHLRKCEDSYDILDTAHALSLSNPSHSDDADGQTATQQVLGGFASLGYSSNTPSQNNLNDADSETSPFSSVPVSPYLGSRKGRKLPWRTLVPILHDPMNTLDILSIEEMGLHSIDVGSKEEWEGFSLSYQCGTCLKPEEDGIRSAQWAVAKSSKKQKKWIVAPESLTASRTVIVSDYILEGSGSKKEIPSPHADSTPIFVCQARFDLRFLQAGNGASSLTTILTNPASHRASAARNGLQSNTFAMEETISKPSLSLSDEQASLAIVSVHSADAAKISVPSVEADTPSGDSRPPFLHSKSSSTIQATLPMVQLESRRPSLGKSISHDSLSFHLPLDASRRLSRSSLATTINDSATLKGYWPASTPLYRPTIVNDTATEELAFADYSIGLKPGVDSSITSIATTTSASPKSSLPSRPSMPALRESKDRIPVLSTIDSERMAEYYRQSSEQSRPSYGTMNHFNDMAWQSGVANSPAGLNRQSARKDRRLSEWFKKKVLPNGMTSPPTMTTPLPAAWEQQRDLHSNASKAVKIGRPVKSYSSVSKNSGDTESSLQGSRGDSYPNGSPFTLSQASLSSIMQPDFESREQSNVITPLSHIQAAHDHNIWPGVFSQRDERRRSNSDDNVVTLSEVAKRKLEADVAASPRQVSNRVDIAGQDDSLTQLSLSMPSQSVLSAYGDISFDAPSKAVPIDLLDMDNVPQKSMTMVIPLPLGKRNDQTAARYIRVSYVPFGADAPMSEDSDRESCDEGHNPSTSSSHTPAWYKKLTNAWNSGRSSSPGSNDEFDLPIEGRGPSTQESFRIIAKVLEVPNQKKSTFKDYSLPHATPFPVILGWCDQQRSVRLVPEGWQAIGLANGPAEADGPLGGLADLIMAGCAACMEL